MKTETFHLELITPCFCGGAEPDMQAEIRAPSIRGQLRWWFRTLGGFRSLAPMPVAQQEAMIFGSTAGDGGRAGKLLVRVSPPANRSLADSVVHPTPNMNEPEDYLLFPLLWQVRRKSALPSFMLTVQWRGEPHLWEDIRAIVAVFGHLGALGFRGRRAMGALAFQMAPVALGAATSRFARPGNIVVKEVLAANPNTSAQCIPLLGNWLRNWRQHGRTPNLAVNQPGFGYARRDHNEGLRRLTGAAVANNPPGHAPKGHDGETFRATLGLPIIQFFSSQPQGAPNRVNWEWNFQNGNATGRFASPVLLRPHRDTQGQWHALVIFVEAHKWPDDPATGRPKQVFLNGQRRNVSLDLYEAMKQDRTLQLFP
jgi:CRISPR-associated protein Cmr1